MLRERADHSLKVVGPRFGDQIGERCGVIGEVERADQDCALTSPMFRYKPTLSPDLQTTAEQLRVHARAVQQPLFVLWVIKKLRKHADSGSLNLII
jgi:hypothetical protein